MLAAASAAGEASPATRPSPPRTHSCGGGGRRGGELRAARAGPPADSSPPLAPVESRSRARGGCVAPGGELVGEAPRASSGGEPGGEWEGGLGPGGGSAARAAVGRKRTERFARPVEWPRGCGCGCRGRGAWGGCCCGRPPRRLPADGRSNAACSSSPSTRASPPPRPPSLPPASPTSARDIRRPGAAWPSTGAAKGGGGVLARRSATAVTTEGVRYSLGGELARSTPAVAGAPSSCTAVERLGPAPSPTVGVRGTAEWSSRSSTRIRPGEGWAGLSDDTRPANPRPRRFA